MPKTRRQSTVAKIPPEQNRVGKRSPEAVAKEHLLDRIEDAIQAGTIDVLDDWDDADQVAITGGELRLLLRVLFPKAFRGEPRKPARRTMAVPGTRARIAVMARRLANGEALYCSGDAKQLADDSRLGLEVSGRKSSSGRVDVEILGVVEETPSIRTVGQG